MENYKNKNLIELIKLAQNNDNTALNEIVKRYQNIVFDEFSKLSINDDLSDLTQDALLKMSKSIKALKSPEKFQSWLQKIIKNSFYDNMRKKKRNNNDHLTNPIINNDYDLGECIIDINKRPDENSLACELKKKLNIAIKSLPTLFKTIVILREIEGLSYEEISTITNLSIGTVKSRLARARIKLRKELEKYITI